MPHAQTISGTESPRQISRYRPLVECVNHWLQLARRPALLLLYVLATAQFVGSLIYLEWPYLNVRQWEAGHAPLPFQTRLLLAPLYRYIDTAPWSVHLAARYARSNTYFFPRGLQPYMMLEFALGIACVLVSGWVALAIYRASSRRQLLGGLVYPLFLGLCAVTYILHTVQNFRFIYDMPSMAIFALGFYLIYFRKPLSLFVLLFAVGTLNRETTLLLLPFWALTQIIDAEGRLHWRGLLQPKVWLVLAALTVYWTAWHELIYSIFPHNASEYYSRVHFNLRCFAKLRYWPQLAAAFAYTWPFLFAYRRRIGDAQLRAWLLVLPVWYGFMFQWGILTETRIFGELLPFLTVACAVAGEEVLAARVLASRHRFESPADARPLHERAA